MDQNQAEIPQSPLERLQTKRKRPGKPLHPAVNAVLFVLTIVTTMAAGAGHLGIGPNLVADDYSLLFEGLLYAFGVLAILTTHEFGHYFAAKHHRMNVSLPFYIPVPLPGFHFGTMGAFIRIRNRIPNRRVLLDIGAAGPIAGLVVSFAVLIYGYATLPDAATIQSTIDAIHARSLPEGVDPAEIQTANITLGNSILFWFFNEIIGGGVVPMNEVYHFPFLFAGWIGLFITALNLIPVSQLDGGHILYALLGQQAHLVSRVVYGGLGVLALLQILEHGLGGGFFWIFWMFLLTLIGRDHPPTEDDEPELSPRQRTIAWICIFTFFTCFIPLPFHLQL